MTQREFQQRQAASWEALETQLKQLEKAPQHPQPDALQTVQLFRDAAHDLALTRHRGYGHSLENRLNAVVIRAARFFRRPRRDLLTDLGLFLLIRFPQALRREWRIFLTASLLFLIPAVIAWAGIADDLLWAQAILGSEGMRNLDESYGGAEALARNHHENATMWGFYIYNNVSICFRMFAGGILAGLGTLFMLIFNGLQLGAAAAYIQHSALDPRHFWTFVIAHGSLELTGIVIVGAAGLILGGGVVFPGALARRDALAAATRRALPLLGGGSIMVFFAAFIEGFWSALAVPLGLKFIVGAACWALVILWLALAGIGRQVEEN